jgi:hypothetical protein
MRKQHNKTLAMQVPPTQDIGLCHNDSNTDCIPVCFEVFKRGALGYQKMSRKHHAFVKPNQSELIRLRGRVKPTGLTSYAVSPKRCNAHAVDVRLASLGPVRPPIPHGAMPR